MTTTLTAPPEITVEPLLTVRDVAARLDVSTMTIYRWRAAGRFPAPDVAIGRHRWLVSTIEGWIRGDKVRRETEGAK